jgi:transketolase
MRLGRSPLPRIHDEGHRLEVGKAEVLREGEDVTLIGTGITVGFALDAADRLKAQGIEAAVINLATLKPIDGNALLGAIGNPKVLVTVEDHNVIGGLGSAVLEALAKGRPAPLLRLGLQDVFGVSGKPKDLFAKYGLDREGIAGSVESFLAERG